MAKQTNKTSKCTITRQDFSEKARALSLQLGGSSAVAVPKQFSTGSFGWNHTGKLPIEVDGKIVNVQCCVNLIVVGSKDA